MSYCIYCNKPLRKNGLDSRRYYHGSCYLDLMLDSLKNKELFKLLEARGSKMTKGNKLFNYLYNQLDKEIRELKQVDIQMVAMTLATMSDEEFEEALNE